MTRKGFSLIELIIACGLIAFGLIVFFSVFSTSTKHSNQTRNSTVAHLLATNMIEEFEAHTYGAPEPLNWTSEVDLPAEIWIQGKKQQMIFHKTIEYANGSFVGKTQDNSDLVTVTITWREAAGESKQGDNKELQIQVPVWR
jgi:Tfp pilus assembly protein PilV